jgi:hypothetical protein
MATSILPVEMQGVMKTTGYRGIGKSFLAAQADAPENIAYFDCEAKAEGIHRQLNFGLYRSLTSEAKTGDPIDLYNIAMDAFATLEQDRFTVAVIDNVSPLELAMNAEGRRGAKEYVQEFGLNLKNVMAGRFGGTKPIVNYMISSRISNVLHSRGVRLIIAISHVSGRWGAGGPIPGKYREKGADRWQELSILSLVLIPGEHAPIPAALVQKEQLGLLTWDSDKQEHIIRRRLPFRIPKCTFAEIRRYLREPADLAHPAPGEMPTVEESDPFSEKLSKEQIALMTLALKKQERDEAADGVLFGIEKPKTKRKQPPVRNQPVLPDLKPEVIDAIRDMLSSDPPQSPAAIARKFGIKVPDVMKVKGSEEV